MDYNAAYGDSTSGYNNFKNFDYNAWANNMMNAFDKMGASSHDFERQLYLNIDSTNKNQYGQNAIIAERLYAYLIGANHETIDGIEDSALEGLAIYNTMFGGNISADEVIINWDLNDFMVKKDQWFITKKPFKVMVDIVTTVNI